MASKLGQCLQRGPEKAKKEKKKEGKLEGVVLRAEDRKDSSNPETRQSCSSFLKGMWEKKKKTNQGSNRERYGGQTGGATILRRWRFQGKTELKGKNLEGKTRVGIHPNDGGKQERPGSYPAKER